MKKHTPDLERCKRMKELGIESPDADFCWLIPGMRKGWYLRYRSPQRKEPYVIAAPSMMEMWIKLPWGDFKINFGSPSDEEHFIFIDRETRLDGIQKEFMDKSLLNALADLLIWLKENNHLEAL